MPKAPLIVSDRARKSVIAAVMIVVLIASLGLAYGLVVLPAPSRYDLTLGQRQRVGDLMIAIPQGWRQMDLGRGLDEFNTVARYSDRHDEARQLIVGSLVLDKPQGPLRVLQFVFATVLGRVNARSVLAGPAIRPLQVGTMVGLRYTDAIETADGVQERFVAVMAAEGRRQWVIILIQPVETRALLQQRILDDDQGFEKICESAVLPKLQGTLPDATTQSEVNP